MPPVTTRLMALDDARASGARALFGEKYGDEVRVVAMGEGSGNTLGWSVELCGGTHVQRTGDIGLITGLSDSGVSSGVRRLEALTGKAARKAANKQVQVVKAVAAELKAHRLKTCRRASRRCSTNARSSSANSPRRARNSPWAAAPRPAAKPPIGAQASATSKLLARAVTGIELEGPAQPGRRGQEAGRLRRGRHRRPVRRRQGRHRGGVTDDLTKRFNAVELVRKGAEVLGGKGGGGRPDMAQAGGPDGSKADAALKAVEAALGG